MRERKRWVAALCVLLLCGAAADEENPQSDDAEPLGYAVARRGTATIDDAYRLFLTLAASQKRVELSAEISQLTFEEVTAQLEMLCVIDSNWSFPATACLRRDVLAYMSASYLGCRPGLITGVFGMTRRYAHREMVYRRIIAPGPPVTLVSGPELMSVISRVDRLTQPRRDVQLTADEIH